MSIKSSKQNYFKRLKSHQINLYLCLNKQNKENNPNKINKVSINQILYKHKMIN